MASYLEDEEDSIIEAQRQSLLDIIEDKNRALNKKSLLHRIVIISQLYHQNLNEIGQHYDRVFKEAQNEYPGEGVTGLLLLYPRMCVHVIESCLDIIIDVLRSLKRESESGTGNMESSKILIVSHDIADRLYNQWSFRILDIQAPMVEEYEASEPPHKMVMDILAQLLKLGTYISRQPKVTLKNAMDTLHDKVPELLPQQDAMGYLLTEEEQCVLTPNQYLALYDQPYDVVLISDLVWPMPDKIFRYT